MSSNDRTTTRRIIVLGSTGSIGTNTLAVIEHLCTRTDHRFDVVGLCAGRNGAMLADQARLFNVCAVAVADENGSLGDLPASARVFTGPGAAVELIDAVAQPGDVVVGAMVGSAGLPAIVRAIEIGCDIALANKETLVAAGEIVMPLARSRGVQLLPIDSEHSAVCQCLRSGRSVDEVRRVVLTASGGPFRNATKRQMQSATVEQALNHPTWNMGAKITIDSATLMNKALEVIEAHHLFDLDSEQIDAIIHPQSIVHSFVEFIDGSILAQMGPPDMKLPIQFALTWPHRAEGCARQLDWSTFRGLEFAPIDSDRFPSIDMAHEVVRGGGTSGAVFNAANEVAVEAFLNRRIGFLTIGEIVRESMDSVPLQPVASLEDVFDADQAAREAAHAAISRSNVVVE